MNEDKRRVCVRGIIYTDGKLFCQRLKDKNGQPKNFYCTPGGGLDPHESLTDGTSRELVEETGVEPRVGKLLFVQQYSENNPTSDHTSEEFLELFYHIENPEDYAKIDETASHFDAEIYDYDFVDPKTTAVLPAFLREIDIADYIQNNRPVYHYTEYGQ